MKYNLILLTIYNCPNIGLVFLSLVFKNFLKFFLYFSIFSNFLFRRIFLVLSFPDGSPILVVPPQAKQWVDDHVPVTILNTLFEANYQR